jgi:hypothetical protein
MDDLHQAPDAWVSSRSAEASILFKDRGYMMTNKEMGVQEEKDKSVSSLVAKLRGTGYEDQISDLLLSGKDR